MKKKLSLHLLTATAVISLAAGCASTPSVSSKNLEADPDLETAVRYPESTAMPADHGDSDPAQPARIVAIAADGSTALNSRTMEPRLIAKTLEKRGVPHNAPIIIAAHPQAPFETVTLIAAQLRQAGYTKVSVQISE